MKRIFKKLVGKDVEYMESDNRGTFQGDLRSATDYWNRRKALRKFEPFVLYEFPDVSDAVSALISLDFIKIAMDSEELICLKPLIYGYYELENGNYEVIICGEKLDEKMITKAEQVFKENHGKLINSKKPEIKKPFEPEKKDTENKKLKPEKSPPVFKKIVKKTEKQPVNEPVPEPVPDKKLEVEFVKEEKVEKRGSNYTFTTYKAKSKADAVLFLRTKLVISKNHIIIVRTPKGSYGRNYNGIFEPGKDKNKKGTAGK